MKQNRNTKQRQLVLDLVRSRCDHPSANQVYMDARSINNTISRATVYRNLHFLVKNGELLHVRAPHADRFDHRLDLHYHVICSRCSAVSDVSLPYNEGLNTQASAQTGYDVMTHCIVFEGLCPDCQNK